jgi:DNA-binding NtrC family response regulator
MKSKAIKILIVDDDESDRIRIERCLDRSGLTCECQNASNVESALEALCETHFDCTILDYHMPGRNGLVGLKMLLKHDPYLAIVMSTGHGDEQIASTAIKLGAKDYISKTDLKPSALRNTSGLLCNDPWLTERLPNSKKPCPLSPACLSTI